MDHCRSSTIEEAVAQRISKSRASTRDTIFMLDLKWIFRRKTGRLCRNGDKGPFSRSG
jgi:hypothetical protein